MLNRFLLILSFTFFLFFKNYSQILVPGIPNVNGNILAFEFDSLTNKLYIAGDFTQVGAVPKQGFAVIDVTSGNVLSDFSSLTIQQYGSNTPAMKIHMQISNNKLYIGGVMNANDNILTQDPLFFLDLSNGTITSIYVP